MKKVINILRLKELKIGAFLVCLLLSTTIWLFLQLSESSKSMVRFKVNYTNIDEDYILGKTLPEFVDVEVESYGFSLLNMQFNDKVRELDLDLSKLIYRENKEDKTTIWSTSSAIGDFNNQIKSEANITAIYPDTVHILLSKKYYKTVPLKFAGKLSFDDQYVLYDLKMKPDSVVITGAKRLAESVDVLPVIANKEGINEDMVLEGKVVSPNNLIHLTKEEVEVQVKTDLIQTGSIMVPVKVKNMNPEYELKLFPSKVKVEFIAGRRIIEDLTPNDFYLTVDFLDILGNDIDSEIPVSLNKYPQSLSKIILKTGKLQYKLNAKN